MSVKNRGPRRCARPGDGSADVNNLSHQLEGLSLSDPKKDKTKTEPQREVMQQENTKSMASHTSGELGHHTCSARDLKNKRNSCTKEDSEGMETLQTKQDGRTVPNNNEDEHVSSKKDDPVSSKKDDPVSSKKDDPVANNNKDNPVANNNRDDPVSGNMSFPVANNKRNNPGPCITDDAVANNEREEMANSSRRPGDPDEESSCTEKWEMKLTGLTCELSFKDLTSCLSQIMSAPVKISPQYKPGDRDVTFVVCSDKPDVNWQDVVHKLETSDFKPVIGSAQLQPVTDCVSVAWLSDKVDDEYLEVYITSPCQTSMPDTCNVIILHFTKEEKKAVVQFEGASAADVARLCSKSHILDQQPLSINPWFGSVGNKSPGAAESDTGSCGQIDLTEWKRGISHSELPCYRLIQKLWGSTVRNIVIDTDKKMILIHGTRDEVMALKESLQSQMYRISSLKQCRPISAAMVTVLAQAGGETNLEKILAEEDITAAVYINSELPSLEVFVSTDSTEAEAAITHILQRKVDEESVHLARYPGLQKEEDVKLICDRLNVAASFYHGNGQPCCIKLQGFRADVQKALKELRSGFTEILLPDPFDKITGVEVDTVAYDQVDMSQSRPLVHCPEMHYPRGDGQPLSCQGGQSARAGLGTLPLTSSHVPGSWSAKPEGQQFGCRWGSSQPSSAYGCRNRWPTPEHHLDKSSKEFTYSQNDFPPLGSPSQRPGEQSVKGVGSEEKEMVTSQNSLTNTGRRDIEKFQSQSNLRNLDGGVGVIKELEVNVTGHHRFDIAGIYQFFTETSDGKSSLKQIEGNHQCTIEVCKLKTPTGIPLTDTSAGKTHKAGRKSKVMAMGKKCVKIIKKQAQSLKATGKKGLTEEYSFGNLKVVIWQGNIIKSHATVLVNVVTPDMYLSSGLCRAICEAGGYRLREALNKKFPVRVGDVISTRAYNISTSDYIYHAVLPQSGGAGDRHVIRKIISDVLKMAHHHSSKCVAFPALGCGGCRFPASLVAEEFVNSFIDFVWDKEVHFEEVKLCISDTAVFQTFKDQFDAVAEDVRSMLATDTADTENVYGVEGDGAVCNITARSEDKILEARKELDKISRAYERKQPVEEGKIHNKHKKKKD